MGFLFPGLSSSTFSLLQFHTRRSNNPCDGYVAPISMGPAPISSSGSGRGAQDSVVKSVYGWDLSCCKFLDGNAVRDSRATVDRRLRPLYTAGHDGSRAPTPATNADQAVEAFVKHYYSTFDTNRSGMALLYRENSMLTFEGQKLEGLQSIVDKFNSLPFPVCHHDIFTVDCQPYEGGVLAFATGTLKVPGREHPLKFSEMFNLIPVQDTFYVLNAIVRSSPA